MRLLIIIFLISFNYCVGQEKNLTPKPFVFQSNYYVAQIKKPIIALRLDFISSTQGFMCRQEWEFEKKTKVPFKLRLGSIDYVNKMEGK